MKALILLLAATALTAAPAAAQPAHHGHHMPTPAKKAPPKKTPAAKKPAPKKKAAAEKPRAKKKAAAPAAKKKVAAKTRKAAAKKAPVAKPAADPHAGHAMPEAPVVAAPVDPHAGHTTPASADGHAGHAMPQAADPHAGHDMSAAEVDPPLAPPPAAAFSGPDHAADLVWGREAMEPSRRAGIKEHGDMFATKFLADRLETQLGKGRDGYAFEGEAWLGGDRNKAWFKGEVEGTHGRRPEHAEAQALWSHAIDPWFDLQTGVRVELAGKNRVYAALGVQGLAPYWIHVDAAAFLSPRGKLFARAEAEHDVRITQQLVLQPKAELTLAAQNIAEEGIGRGLSSVELGARLRYEVRRDFAPYVGISLDQAFGQARRYRREEGADAGELRLVTGVRAWF